MAMEIIRMLVSTRRCATSFALLGCLLLSGCPSQSSTTDLTGNWKVDLEETVKRARKDGLPASAEPQIRQIFSDGLLEINDSQLVMRITGMEGSESLNYTASKPSNGCYELTVMGSPKPHSYCVAGDQLVARDPEAQLAVVFKRQ